MKTLWIARVQDFTPGGSGDLAIFDDRDAAMDKARDYWNHLTPAEKENRLVSVEGYSVNCSSTASKSEAYDLLNENSCWPDPVYYMRYYTLFYCRAYVPPEDDTCDELFDDGKLTVFAASESDANQKGREALAAHYRDLGYTATVDPHGVTVEHDGVEEWFYGFDPN